MYGPTTLLGNLKGRRGRGDTVDPCIAGGGGGGGESVNLEDFAL